MMDGVLPPPASVRRGPAGAGPSRRVPRGFSFIEILIVMGILAVLAAAVTVAMGVWSRKGPQFQTRNRVNVLAGLVTSWRQKFDFYPPTDVADLPRVTMLEVPIKGAKQNSTNGGCEALYLALHWPGFKAEHDFSEREVGNTDEDALAAAAARTGQPELFEFLDDWGNPIVYVNSNDYAKYEGGGLEIVLGPESTIGGGVSARPWQRADGGFINADTFQIFSLGPDGEPNTEDDIGNWSGD